MNHLALMLLGAELIFILMRKKDIEILVRSKTERESKEQYQVERGLLRSVILEGLIFVPVSATLMWLFSPLIKAGLDAWLPKFPQQALSSFYVGLGLLSYGFPFASAQRFVVHRSLNIAPFGRTLKHQPLSQGPDRCELNSYLPRWIASPSS